MSINHWDERYLRMAREVASWSRDPSTKCGAVIVRPDKTVASMGFNGFPQALSDNEDYYNDREVKYARIVHAELNALLFKREEVRGYTVYVWPMPACDRCTAALIQAGISRIVSPYGNAEKRARWGRAFELAEAMWREAGAEIVHLDLEGDDTPPPRCSCGHTG